MVGALLVRRPSVAKIILQLEGVHAAIRAGKGAEGDWTKLRRSEPPGAAVKNVHLIALALHQTRQNKRIGGSIYQSAAARNKSNRSILQHSTAVT